VHAWQSPTLAHPAAPLATCLQRHPCTGADLGGGGGGGTEVTGHSLGAVAYFMLLLCVRLKLFRCRFVPYSSQMGTVRDSHRLSPTQFTPPDATPRCELDMSQGCNGARTRMIVHVYNCLKNLCLSLVSVVPHFFFRTTLLPRTWTQTHAQADEQPENITPSPPFISSFLGLHP